MALPSWGYAQDASCVSRSAFLKGEFTVDSVPCEPRIAGPLKYCNARVIEVSQLQKVSEAKLDFFDYYGSLVLFKSLYRNPDIAMKVARADSIRLDALLDEGLPEEASELFYTLGTAILSAHLTELALKADIDANFQIMNSMEWEGQYFLYGLPKSVPDLERVFECVTRCGDAEGDMKKLTRSPVFSACTRGLVQSTY